MTDFQIDLNPLVAAVLGVLTEPYQTFSASLHAQGRITDAEVDHLRAAILERSERLADLMKARLREWPEVTVDTPRAASPTLTDKA